MTQYEVPLSPEQAVFPSAAGDYLLAPPQKVGPALELADVPEATVPRSHRRETVEAAPTNPFEEWHAVAEHIAARLPEGSELRTRTEAISLRLNELQRLETYEEPATTTLDKLRQAYTSHKLAALKVRDDPQPRLLKVDLAPQETEPHATMLDALVSKNVPRDPAEQIAELIATLPVFLRPFRDSIITEAFAVTKQASDGQYDRTIQTYFDDVLARFDLPPAPDRPARIQAVHAERIREALEENLVGMDACMRKSRRRHVGATALEAPTQNTGDDLAKYITQAEKLLADDSLQRSLRTALVKELGLPGGKLYDFVTNAIDAKRRQFGADLQEQANHLVREWVKGRGSWQHVTIAPFEAPTMSSELEARIAALALQGKSNIAIFRTLAREFHPDVTGANSKKGALYTELAAWREENNF